MLKKSPFPTLIAFTLLVISCEKSVERPTFRYHREDVQWKFKVIDINEHCMDYYGRTAVRLKCVQYPYGMEHYYQMRFNGKYVYTTILPVYFREKGKEFVGEIEEYIDWPERIHCISAASQINIANIDYAD